VHEPFLRYARYRWLKVSLAVVAGAIIAYLTTPPIERSGGSPIGYGLGVAAAALMLLLTWFGIRKRSYGPPSNGWGARWRSRWAGAPLRGWLSAHVYLGATLLVLVPLHAAFRFGWNVHTLAAVLTAATVLSGVIGVFMYVSIPQQMTQNRPGEKLVALFEQVGALDTECKVLASGLPTAVAEAVAYSVQATRIGGGALRQLAGADPSRPTQRALRVVEQAQYATPDSEALRKLRASLTLKESLLRRITIDTRLKAFLDTWLVVHVPLAIAAVAAVAAHVVAVLYYR
jgi:hypothetical protein